MSFIPTKKRKARQSKGSYKSYLTSKTDEDDSRKQGISYKAYLTDESVEQVPRTTIHRWQTKDQEELRDQPQEEQAGPSHAATSLFCPTDDDDDDNDHDSSEPDSDQASDKISSLDSSTTEIPTMSSDDEETYGSDIRMEGLQSENEDRQLNLPLYEGSKVDVRTAIGSILDFYLSNNLPKQGLNELLQLIDSLLPPSNLVPKTKYKLDQYIMKSSPSAKYVKHFYCLYCHFYIGENCQDINECPSCSKSIAEKSFFVTYDIKILLKNFLENGDAGKYIFQPLHEKTNQTNIEDISDSICYQQLKEKYQLGGQDLMLIWNTDGVPVFKSSKSQLWPLQFTISELPPGVRNRYVLVCGIWFGPEKPDMNTFLKPFTKELQELQSFGFEWCVPNTMEVVCSKVFAPISCLDAVARASVANFHQFNGEFGCTMCENKGEVIPCGQGTSRIYRAEDALLRTNQSILESCQQAVDSGNIVKGVKGPSILSTVFYLNLAETFVPDYMHCVLLGVVRQFLFLWLNPANRDKPWCLSSKKFQLDKSLSEVKPPSEINRMPRSVELRKYWKASEYRAWLLFYSAPALLQVLPQKYFNHWLLLVFSIFTLLQEKISKLEIKLCTVLLGMFCSSVEDLYGQEQMTFNVHQLTHLPLSVERWGPLWATSAFSFENNNGLLLKLIHGTQQIAMQITNTFKYINGLCVLKSSIESSNHVDRESNKVVIGKPLKSKPQLSFTEKNQLSNHLSCEFTNIQLFSKCTIGKTLFTSQAYTKSSKRNNSTVMYQLLVNSKLVSYIGYIKFFFKKDDDLSDEVFCMMERHQMTKTVFLIKECNVKIKHVIPIKPDSSSLDIVSVNDIEKKLVFLNKELVAYFPNAYECNL